MDKKALVILAEGFEETEAIIPIDVLRRVGIEVVLAGLHDVKTRGAHGVIFQVEVTLDSVEGDFDVVILPGGMPGAQNLYESEKVNVLIRQMYEADKIIAAICAAPAVVLAATGILEGKSATCYPGMQDRFSKETAYLDKPVVVDGNIITSQGVGTALAFALQIVLKLCGQETCSKVAKAILMEQ